MMRLLPLLLALAPWPSLAGPVDAKDFSPDAARISFDTLSHAQTLDDQYRGLGVRFTDSRGQPLRIIDSRRLNPSRTTQSADNFVVSEPPPVGLEVIAPPSPPDIVIDFSQGQDRVGLYFGGSSGTTATLIAYDADGGWLDEVTATAKDASITHFIGLEYKPGTIRRVVLRQSQSGPAMDELIFEPGPKTGSDALQTLGASGKPRESRLRAMDAVLLSPSPAGLGALRKLAFDADEPDAYLRERAVIALEQLQDRDALPDLLKLARHERLRDLALAAYNAAWALREAFPPDHPPALELTLADSDIDYDARRITVWVKGVVTAGDADMDIVARLRGKGGFRPDARKTKLRFLSDNTQYRYEGPLQAGETRTVQAEFWFPLTDASRIGEVALSVTRYLSARSGKSAGDLFSYEKRLYIDLSKGVQADGSNDPAAKPEHVLTGTSPQGGLY